MPHIESITGLSSARISFTRNDLDADDQSDRCRQEGRIVGSSSARPGRKSGWDSFRFLSFRLGAGWSRACWKWARS